MSIVEREQHADTMHASHDILLRGSREMAQALGLRQRTLDHLLASGSLKSPRKVGGRWFASRSKLLSEFVGD
jgi:predicted DNA-binding transcriptional regulator AlpA